MERLDCRKKIRSPEEAFLRVSKAICFPFLSRQMGSFSRQILVFSILRLIGIYSFSLQIWAYSFMPTRRHCLFVFAFLFVACICNIPYNNRSCKEKISDTIRLVHNTNRSNLSVLSEDVSVASAGFADGMALDGKSIFRCYGCRCRT